MKINEGITDRWVRVVLAAVLAVVAFSVGISSVTGIILAVVAAISLVTGASGRCPLYKVFNINTLKGSSNRHHPVAS